MDFWLWLIVISMIIWIVGGGVWIYYKAKCEWFESIVKQVSKENRIYRKLSQVSINTKNEILDFFWSIFK